MLARLSSRLLPSSHAIQSIVRNNVVLSRGFASQAHSYVAVPGAPEAKEGSEAEFGYQSTDNFFEDYRIQNGEQGDEANRTAHYVALGSAAFLYASFGRSMVLRFVNYLSPTAEMLAFASIEVDISGIAEGLTTTVKWRGKPVFIRHRTDKEVAAAKADDNVELRDPQTDAERIRGNEKYMVVIGICTHLGCVPASAAGDYNGWFCPCHGSHYDLSGRIRKGPAPLNLEIPPYKYLSDTKILLG